MRDEVALVVEAAGELGAVHGVEKGPEVKIWRRMRSG
jgi:hypothetical protein